MRKATTSGFDLTPQQFGVLAQLGAEGAMTQADLARATLIRPQSAEAVLTPMIDGGLIVRSGERVRGRPNPLLLTASGKDLLDRVWPSVVKTNDLSHLGLAAGDTQQLNAWSQQLTALASREG